MTATAREIQTFTDMIVGRMTAVSTGAIPVHVGAAQATTGVSVRIMTAFFADRGVRFVAPIRRADVVAEVADTFFV